MLSFEDKTSYGEDEVPSLNHNYISARVMIGLNYDQLVLVLIDMICTIMQTLCLLTNVLSMQKEELVG